MAAPLDSRQQQALVGLLRAAACGEIVTEVARRKFCEAGFDPRSAFEALAPSYRMARIGAEDIFKWLREQPHSIPNLTVEDVASITKPYEVSGGYLNYQQFLRMVLPKDDPSHMHRGGHQSFQGEAQELPPEVAYRLTELLVNEIDVARHLKHHRKQLGGLGVGRQSILQFLNAEDSVCCGGSGDLVSPSAIRRVLVDRLQALNQEQCEALLRRINPSGACLAPFDELAKMLSQPTGGSERIAEPSMPSVHAFSEPQTAGALGGRGPVHAFSEPQTTGVRGFDHGGPCHSSPTACPTVHPPPLQDPLPFGDSCGASQWHAALGSPGRPSPDTSLVIPALHGGVSRLDSGGRVPHIAWREPQASLDASLSAIPAPCSGRGAWLESHGESETNFAHESRGASSELPIGVVNGSRVYAQHSGSQGDSRSDPYRAPPIATPPVGGWSAWSPPTRDADVSKVTSMLRDLSPTRNQYGGIGGGTRPVQSPDCYTTTHAQDLNTPCREPVDYKPSPAVYEFGRSALASTQASTNDFMSPNKQSPWSPKPPAAPSSYANNYSTPQRPPISNYSGALCRTPGVGTASGAGARSSSVPAGPTAGPTVHFTHASPHEREPSHRRESPLSYLKPATPRAPLSASPWRPSPSERQADGRLRAAEAVLKAIAKQGQLDAKVEAAKTNVQATASLEGIFCMLDRLRKGYVTDTDLWQFSQDFGASTAFGAICALVREVQWRCAASGASPSALTGSGRMSLRELGTLRFPASSREYQEMLLAPNDAEALSALYLLANSELCPGCGIHVQRDADARGCPSVTCAVCGTAFRCRVAVSDHAPPEGGGPVPAAAQYHLYKLVDAAAHAAEESERGRRQLALLPHYDVASTLRDVFVEISDGRLSFQQGDLRRALASRELHLTEAEFGALWLRYSADGREVTFPDFAHNLKSRMGVSAV